MGDGKEQPINCVIYPIRHTWSQPSYQPSGTVSGSWASLAAALGSHQAKRLLGIAWPPVR